MEELTTGGVSRRSVIVGGATAALFAALGLNVTQTEVAYAVASPPLTGADAAAAAAACATMTRADLETGGIISGTPWSSYAQGAAWCAWFASWWMRGATNFTTVGYTSSWDLFNMFPEVAASQAQPGDLIYYTYGHTGIVKSVVNGVIHPVEGNCTDDPNRVRDRGYPISGEPFKISRPAYPGGTYQNQIRRKKMDYGLVKGPSVGTVYALRFSDGALRALTSADYAAFLSTGLIVQTTDNQANMNSYISSHGTF